ncbi:unnamed protein product [Fusarium graminearum]|nr:unnamed protein product [Fusarium graminearum]
MVDKLVLGQAPGQEHSGRESELYSYTPLNKRQIRVLELSPGSRETDQLRGKLLVKHLEELPPCRKPFSSDVAELIDLTKHVCFEAISYVWGEASFTECLVTPGGFIRITPSLASILRRVRHHEESRLYWVDGLCINQNDISEKEIQVPLMGVIYASAVRVLCDVCDENENINRLLDAMQRYWKKNIRRGFELAQGRSMILSKETTAAIMGVRLPTQEEADEIEGFEAENWTEEFLEFICLPWFHRLWILQEFVLGRDVTIIFGRRHLPWGELWAGTAAGYSGSSLPWDSMELAKPENVTKLTSLSSICFIRSCRVIDPNTTHGRDFINATRVLIGGAELSQTQLPMSLMAGCFKECTVPRDRYFAILGLVDEASDGKIHDLQVDYTSPISDITMRFWKHALQLSSGGELVLLAGMAGRSDGYPSWLRDITVRSPLGSVWQSGPLSNAWHKAGGDLDSWSARFDNKDPDQMIVQGFFVDTIAEVSSMKPNEVFEMEDMIIWFAKAIDFFTSGHETDMQYSWTGENVQDAAMKTVFDISSQEAHGDSFASICQLGQSLLSIVASHPDKGQDMMEAIIDEAENKMDILTELLTQIFSTSGLRVCKTEKGMFAMLPKEVCAGDSVWALQGCRLPAILRSSPAVSESYDVVGFGYVYGIMNEEVMQVPGFEWVDVCLR